MRKILLDTDIIIDILRNHRETIQLVKKISTDELYISGITEAEIFAGKDLSDENKRKLCMELLSKFEKINPNNIILRKAGEFRRKYGVPLPNCIVAATTYELNAELLTRNLKHYMKIKEVKIFRF